MKELRFSVCNEPTVVHEVLQSFNRNRPPAAKVQLHWLPWDHQKQELTAMAIHGSGADVSQVGSPMISDLIAMDALRPFTPAETRTLGDAQAFSPLVWQQSRLATDEQLYAVPWIIDARAIYYWRDMLSAAGVDELTAFSSAAHMEETLQRLQASGVAHPWALALNGGPLIQPACTWIWEAGGDIGTETELLILDPKTLLGLRNFFSLYRYMPRVKQPLGFAYTYQELFARRQTAVTMGSLAPFAAIRKSLLPELQAQLGVALAPGPLFVGSSSLVIWKNTRNATDAVSLIRYLLSEEGQRDYCLSGGYLPSRLSVLNSSTYTDDPHLSIFAQSALIGRTFAHIKFSGLFEDLLSAAIERIWIKIIANPEINLEPIIREELEPIARRSSLWKD